MATPNIEFEFSVERSKKPEDQSPNFKCDQYKFGGKTKATSINRVKEFCATLMVIPGVYHLRIRNTDGGAWIPSPPIDTRNPEAAARAGRRSRKGM